MLEIVSKRRDTVDARRFVYRLTERGIDLAPMLVEMILWSSDHFLTAAPPAALAEMRHHRERFLQRVRTDWEATRRG